MWLHFGVYSNAYKWEQGLKVSVCVLQKGNFKYHSSGSLETGLSGKVKLGKL